MNYSVMVQKATRNELTPQDICQVVLALDEHNRMSDKQIAQTKRDVRDIETEYPLLPPEADDIAKAVKRKGVELMGGKKSNAYADKDIRTKVYRDIYCEIKREYGLVNERGGYESYKKLKRKYFNGALNVVSGYALPTVLAEEIESINDLDMGD